MPTLALPAQASSALEARAAEWKEYVSRTNGPEASEIYELARKVQSHWLRRAEVLISGLQEADDYSYLPVPANRVSYVKTHYVYMGKGTPLPFDLDDE